MTRFLTSTAILISTVFLTVSVAHGQTKVEEDEYILTKNICGAQMLGDLGFGGVHYERILTNGKWINISSRSGLGMIFGEAEVNIPSVEIIMSGFNILIGNKIAIEAGIYPGFWLSRTTYFVATGNIGVRYQERRGGMFFRIAYNPLLYPTDKADIFPFAIGIGKCF